MKTEIFGQANSTKFLGFKVSFISRKKLNLLRMKAKKSYIKCSEMQRLRRAVLKRFGVIRTLNIYLYIEYSAFAPWIEY